MVGDWHGDNPYYLLCVGTMYSTLGPVREEFVAAHKKHQAIDLDESGWASTYSEWMRMEGEWHLIRKDGDAVVLSIMIHTEEQPYYTSRVFASTTSPKSTRAYGIGKKQADGTMLRLWILENGLICGGDDVDEFAPALLR